MEDLRTRKMQQHKDKGQKISVRLDDGRVIHGIVTEIDNDFFCIVNEDKSEEVIPLSSITTIKVVQDANDMWTILNTAYVNNQVLSLKLSDGTMFEARVDGIDKDNVSFQTHFGEHLVQIKDVSKASPIQNISKPEPPPGAEKTLEISASLYKVIESVRRELLALSWADNDVQPIERTCPVSIRTNSLAGKIWGRALNYHNDRSWQKAAQAFEEFGDEFPTFHVGFYNAGVCYNLYGDFSQAVSQYDHALKLKETSEIYRNGIWSCIRLGFWQLGIQFMAGYLRYSSGSDQNSFKVLEFQAKYGLYKDAASTIIAACDLTYPIDPIFGLRICAFISSKVPSLSGKFAEELDRHLSYSDFSTEQLKNIAILLERNLTNHATIDYISAQDAENIWHKNIEDKKIENQLRRLQEKLSLQRVNRQYKLAMETCNEILRLSPNDSFATIAQKELLEMKQPSSNKQTMPAPKLPYNLPTYMKATRRLSTGNLEEAERLFRICIQNNDNLDKSVLNLANIYLRKNNIEEGVNLLNQYVGTATDKEAFYNTLGNLCFKGGNYSAAINAYMSVRDLQTDRTRKINPMMSMAATYFRMENSQEVKNILQEVLRINPRHEQAKNFLRRVKALETEPNQEPLPSKRLGFDNITDLIASMTRPVGLANVGISKFIQLEVEEGTVTGLDRLKIEKKQYTVKDAEFLFIDAAKKETSRPEQRIPLFISCAKILLELGQEHDERYTESLRNYCATSGDYYAIKNRDSARAY